MTPLDTWRYGLGTGFAAGLLAATLIVLCDPAAAYWSVIQSALAWTLAGWVVMATDTGFRPLTHGALVATLINLPWLIQFAIAPGYWLRVPALLALSLVFGAALGVAKWHLRRPRVPSCEWA